MKGVLPSSAFDGGDEELTTAKIELSRWARKYLRPNKSAMHEGFRDILAQCESEADVDQLLLECASIPCSSGTRRKWRRWSEQKKGAIRSSRLTASIAG